MFSFLDNTSNIYILQLLNLLYLLPKTFRNSWKYNR